MDPQVPQGARADNNVAIEELSRCMLNGWTMLSDTCATANCNMPLARDLQGNVRCCACGLDQSSRRCDDTEKGSSSSAVPVVEGAKVSERKESSKNLDDTFNGAAQDDPPSENLTAVVPANSRGMRVIANPDGSNTVERGVSTRDRFRENNPSIENSAAAAAVQRRDLASLSLGEKLLQGWTLLQESCSRCATPLLRDAAGTLLCVTCSMHLEAGDIVGQEHGGAGEKLERDAAGTSRDLAGSSVRMQFSASAIANQQTQRAQLENAVRAHANTSAMIPRPDLAHQQSQFQGQGSSGEANTLAPVQLTDVVPAQPGQLRAPQFPTYQVDGRAYSVPRRHPVTALPTDRRPRMLEGTPESEEVPAISDAAPNPVTASAGDVGANVGGAPKPPMVAMELYETEQAVAAMLAPLRSRLNAARDVESVRTACAAIQAAADAISALRRASSSVS